MLILRNFLAALAALTLSCFGFSALGQKSVPGISLSAVVIDPGHGGKDAGCTSPSGKTMEKTIVLDIAERLKDKIRAGYPDVKVIMTRSDDTFIGLQERADIANRNKANLFISIHINSAAAKRTSPNGYSVHILGQYTSKKKDLYAGNMDIVSRENSVIKLEDDYHTRYEGFDPSDPESYIFMNLMQNAFLEQSLEFAQDVDREMKGGAVTNSRGISQDPFWVLWRTAMPSVLVECGFMSNTADRESLITEKGRERIASDLYDAFKKFKKNYDGSVAAPQDSSEASASAEVVEVSAESEVVPSQYASAFYGTQILATSKSMSADDRFFKGNEVRKVKDGKYYKYIIGSSADLEEAKKEYKRITLVFPDAFMVIVESGNVSRVK